MNARPSPDAPQQLPVKTLARAAGALYLVVIVIGLLGESLIRGTLVVPGDPDATAKRILDSLTLWRIGVAAQDLLLICAVAMGPVFYLLLRPVNKLLALLALMFSVVSLAVESVSALHLHAVIAPLTNGALISGMKEQARNLMAYQAIVAHGHAFALALIFFGVECLIIGYLIRESGYFPRAIGTLFQLAGVCYLINSFSIILFPSLQSALFPYILLPCLMGESVFCFYLLLKGVNVPEWERQVRHA